MFTIQQQKLGNHLVRLNSVQLFFFKYGKDNLLGKKNDFDCPILLAAFVAGVKMALPNSMERINNTKYEEINIPVNEGPPLEVGNNLVPISSLDEIGQRAFANCKTLNR